METMRKKAMFTSIVALVLALSITGIAFARGGAEADPDRVRIAYLPPNFEQADFYGQYYTGLVSGLDELGINYELVQRTPATHDDHTQQLAIVEDVLTIGVDYIVMAPTHYEGQQAAYRTINAEGVPLFIFNYSDPFPAEFGATALSYIGYQHRDGGEVLANYIRENFPRGSKIAILYGTPTEISYQRAAKDMLEDFGMEIVFEHYANWQRDQAYDATVRLLTSRDDVDIIIGVSSFTAMGAVRAAADEGVLDDIAIFGAGAILEELDAIIEGTLTGAWYRDPVTMGQETARYIHMHMEGREDEIPEVYNVPLVMIDSVEAIREHINPATFEAVGRQMP